jgi:acyl-CoA reductase-like NAD-dependent aldehyde dehydrogenase
MTTNDQTNGRTNDVAPTASFNESSTVPLWLDGKEVTTSKTFDVNSPVTGKKLYTAAAASESDAQAAIDACVRAFPAWSQTKPTVRRDIFLRAADEFRKRRDECYKYAFEETGAPPAMFDFEFSGAIELCKSIAGLIQTVQGSIPTPAAEDQTAIMVREPYGVVLGIAPWNAPYALGLRACLQPLAMGNTVVLKGPEASPGTYWAISSVLHAAGLPPGCLNTLYHRPGADAASITNFLVSSPAIKKVNFTGSTGVGSIIASLAGKNLKPVLMELGGKAPSIVCDDADINKAAFSCALGAFLHAGQICMSTERIIVHRKIVEPFKEALKTSVEQIFSEHTPILVSAVPVTKNKKLLADAVSKGAGVVYGDPDTNETLNTHMKPVILDNVQKEMDIYYTESFGPTVSIIAVDSDEEALQIANDTDYGLSSAVFTENLRRGLSIAKRIETGAVHINNMTVHDEAALPHGGAKKSGFGRFNGREGLGEWVRTKVITWKD